MNTKRLFRSSSNKMLAGVCGGIGEYFNLDPVIVRLIWVAATFFSAGAGVIGYIIAIAVVPEEGRAGSEQNKNGCLFAIIITIAVFIAIPILLSVLGVFGGLMAWGMRMIPGFW